MGRSQSRYSVFWCFRQISRLGRPLGTRRSQRLASQPQRSLQRTPPLISGGCGDSCCGQHRAGERCCQRCGQYAPRERAGAFADLHLATFPDADATVLLSLRVEVGECSKRELERKAGRLETIREKREGCGRSIASHHAPLTREGQDEKGGTSPFSVMRRACFSRSTSEPVPAGDRP